MSAGRGDTHDRWPLLVERSAASGAGEAAMREARVTMSAESGMGQNSG